MLEAGVLIASTATITSRPSSPGQISYLTKADAKCGWAPHVQQLAGQLLPRTIAISDWLAVHRLARLRRWSTPIVGTCGRSSVCDQRPVSVRLVGYRVEPVTPAV